MVRPVIKKMVEEMLDDAAGRPTAVQLGYKAKKIIQQADKDLRDQEPHRNISRSSTTQSWELNLERGIPPRSNQARPPKALSSLVADSYLDKTEPLSTVTTIEESPTTSKKGTASTQPQRDSFHNRVTSTSARGDPSSSESAQHTQLIGSDHHENSFSSTRSQPPFSSSSSSNIKETIPHMTISQALFWIICQKDDRGDMVPREHRRYLNDLADRDHVSFKSPCLGAN